MSDDRKYRQRGYQDSGPRERGAQEPRGPKKPVEPRDPRMPRDPRVPNMPGFRDVFRCASLVCTRRDVTPHHLVFRSHGGGDEDENVASLCAWCHLEGVHRGGIGAEPPASHIRWRIGRSGTLRVEGRARKAA